MKTLTILLVLSVLIAGCGGPSQTEKKPQDQVTEPIELTELNLDVKGMTCEGCENAVIRSLGRLDGVIETQASHEEELVTVRFNADAVSSDQIKEAITRVGYTVAGEIEND